MKTKNKINKKLGLEKTKVQWLYNNVNSPVAYTSPKRIYNYIKSSEKNSNITLDKITSYLSELDSYTLFKPSVTKFKHPKVRIPAKNLQIELDLADVSSSSSFNSGIKFLFIAIDVFSKLAFVFPMKDKSSDSILLALNTLISKYPHIEGFSSDRGSEFKSTKFKNFLTKHNLRHFFVGGSTKGTIVESFIRTLRRKIAHYKDVNNTEKYIDVLDKIVDGYNNTCHSSTKFKPVEVDKRNELAVYENLYLVNKNKPTNQRYQYKIGDTVRISGAKSLFRKESYKRFSEELFTIFARFKKDGVAMYKLKDCSDEVLEGSFFNSELAHVTIDKEKLYKIEYYLDEKKIKGVTYVLAKFVGYNKKCAMWLKKKDVVG